jgi:hypothetical protein
MGRGGYRPGAGRKPGSKTFKHNSPPPPSDAADDLTKLAYRARKYGITLDQWVEKYAAQGFACEICKRKLKIMGGSGNDVDVAHTDHCHASGQVRGILCRNCNTMLGVARDQVETLMNAAIYLEKHRGVQVQDKGLENGKRLGRTATGIGS